MITITLHLNKTCVKAPWEEEVFFYSIILYSEMDSESRGEERGKLEKEWADWEEEEG